MSTGTFKTCVYPKSKMKAIAVCGAKSLFEVLLLSIKKYIGWSIPPNPQGIAKEKRCRGTT